MSGSARSRGEIAVEGLPASWVRDGPLDGRPLVLLAHGSGAPYTHPFMEAVASGLARRSMAVVRFHFPYMERIVLEGKRRPPDRTSRLIATWRAMVERASRYWSGCPLVLAGKSLGARMASMLLAAGGAPAARGVVYLGYPLHPPGRPEELRCDHLPLVPVPQLFVSGTKDPLCDLDLLAPVLDRIGPRARLHVVEGGDHSLSRKRSDPLAGSGEWIEAAASFLRACL